MIHYFDQTASRPCTEAVLQVYEKALREHNYNPASRHIAGRESAAALEEALKRSAKLLGAKASEIIVTSGASESTNSAILGVAFAEGKRCQRILTSTAEHSATAETLNFLARRFDYVIDRWQWTESDACYQELEHLLQTNDYDLVSLIAVNNENGAILDWQRVAALVKKYQKKAVLHLDVVQAIGKVPFNFQASGADLASISCHKFAAPKGIGFLLCRDKLRLEPFIHGGGQQHNRRSGTENPPLVIAATAALELALAELPALQKHGRELQELLLKELDAAGLDYRLHSPEQRSPAILSLEFPALRAESLQTALSALGFCVSIGSACSSQGHKEGQNAEALGMSLEAKKHSIRISFALEHSADDVKALAAAIADCLKRYGVTRPQ